MVRAVFKGTAMRCLSTGEVHRNSDRQFPGSLAELLALPIEQLAVCDIALVNLLCAQGLPGSEALDIPEALATLDQWTEVVRKSTHQRLPQLLSRPQRMTEAQLRLWLVIRTLRDRFGVVHRDGQVKGEVERMGPRFAQVPTAQSAFEHFADSRYVFIHGLLGPEHIGTCSSMPVLYAAVARRLGYPVKLATNTGHVFNRWEDERECFNMEGTGADYINIHPDDYYIDDPRPWTDYERYNDYLLRSRTPVEELSLFCSIRAACLYRAGRVEEALEFWTRAWCRMPENAGESSNIRFALSRQQSSSPRISGENRFSEGTLNAPPMTQSALLGAKGLALAFEGCLSEAQIALRTACQLVPDDTLFPRLHMSLESRQFVRLPPSKSILASRKLADEAEHLISQQKGPEAVTRLVKAYRLHPRHRAYLRRISDIVTCSRTARPHFGTLSHPHFEPEEIGTLLNANGHWFLERGELLEARQAFEEALHLSPGSVVSRAGMTLANRRLHEESRNCQQ